jgi:CheY-like chemotaxis protein
VVQAGNGREGLDALAKERPTLITLDLFMPEMDGFTFLEEKALHAEYAGIPVIVISAVADQLDASPLSADAVLSKPVRRSDLLELVNSIVDLDGNQGRPKVLLVDYDPKAIKIISSYLPADRLEVLSAYGGRDGLETALAERPDIIVLDLMMPDMSGFEVLRELKQDSRTRAIPVIVLTAKILTEDERTQLKLQVEVVAEKGRAGRDQILREVETILGRYGKS